jgi:hypothetical protein
MGVTGVTERPAGVADDTLEKRVSGVEVLAETVDEGTDGDRDFSRSDSKSCQTIRGISPSIA